MDFPLIDAKAKHQVGFSYLDSAATSQIAQPVLESMYRFETTSRANVHRGIYELADEATDAYETSRETVGQFFGGPGKHIVFTSGATAALNQAILGWGRKHLRAGDLVVLDTANHHANIVPWQMLTQHCGIELAFTGVDADGRMNMKRWYELLDKKPKAVALVHTSNVTGQTDDIERMIQQAHDARSMVVLDCAQAAGHGPLDLVHLNPDFAAVSAHKMYGPFGIGALWIRLGLCDEMYPVFGGGGMIERVDETGFVLTSPPACFEAGTPNISGAVGFAAACSWLRTQGLEKVHAHTMSLVDQALDLLLHRDDVRIVGSTQKGDRVSLLSFVLADMHPHDVAERLGSAGICVRAGTHCAQPLHKALGLPATVRISFSVHSQTSEVQAFARQLECM